jgi:GAF domain-containing protein
MPPDPTDPTAAFAELGRIRLGDTDLDDVLNRVAQLARSTVPGAAEVSLTLVRNDRAGTAACTGPLALQLDRWQYEHGTGPCLEVAGDRTAVSLPDLSAEPRWPDWAAYAASAGAGSSLSVGLPIRQEVRGALNIYGAGPRAFDEDAVLLAVTFGDYAAVAVANAHVVAATTGLARRMQAAMARRAVIEQAKGILMGRRRCTAEEAFALLTAAARNANRTVSEVAADLVAGLRGW